MDEAERELRQEIQEIAGGAWWHSSGEDIFTRLARDLMERGQSRKEALAFLESAYAATADEFGG